MKTKQLFPILALIASVMAAGCGDDNEPAAAAPPPAGGATPQNQAGVYGEYELDPEAEVDATACDFPYKFRVTVEGSFTAGPCTAGGQPVRGRITATELQDLSEMIQPIAEANLADAPNCVAEGVDAAQRLDLTLSSGTSFRVLDATTSSVCFRGPPEDVADLNLYLISLMETYYPRRTQLIPPAANP